MKTCAVQSCGNDSCKRPDLCFFNIPRDPVWREDWLEVLGINRKDNINKIAVCELHFKAKDIRAGKSKDLKPYVVPNLNLGQCDPFDSDEEFIPYDTENDSAILDLQSDVFSSNSQQTVKQEPKEEKPEKETIPDLEQETGRRPSRRAALVAAKKISNTVRSFGDSGGRPANTLPSPKPVNAPHPYTRPKSKKNPPVNVDLQMECGDDFLSPIQAEFLLKAQIQYNMVMKNLRELMACNVKVIQTDANGVPTVVTSAPSVNLKNGNVPVNSKSVKIKPQNTGSAMVVPMKLIRSPIIIT